MFAKVIKIYKNFECERGNKKKKKKMAHRVCCSVLRYCIGIFARVSCSKRMEIFTPECHCRGPRSRLGRYPLL